MSLDGSELKGHTDSGGLIGASPPHHPLIGRRARPPDLDFCQRNLRDHPSR